MTFEVCVCTVYASEWVSASGIYAAELIGTNANKHEVLGRTYDVHSCIHCTCD